MKELSTEDRLSGGQLGSKSARRGGNRWFGAPPTA